MFERIAFLKLCCPGDILFTTPAVRSIRNHFPDTRLFYLLGKYSSFVAEHNPHIDQTVILPPPFELSGVARGARAFLQGAFTIAQNRFDLVISFHRSRAVAAMAKLGRAGKVASFDTARPMTDFTAQFDPEDHEIQRYLDLVSLLGAKPQGMEMEYRTTPKEDEWAERLIAKLLIKQPFAVIAPGGGENPGSTMHIKRWPAERFKELARHLRQRGLHVIAVGSESEKDLAQRIEPDINLAGETAFAELAPIFKKATVVIANDSGPLYLASAVGAKTVGIYGPSSPDLVAPRSHNHRTVVRKVECHPCYKPATAARGIIGCHTGTWACMATLETSDVISAVEDLLAPLSVGI